MKLKLFQKLTLRKERREILLFIENLQYAVGTPGTKVNKASPQSV